MNTEFELKFLEIDKARYRKRLKKVGAKLVREEFLQKRKTYDLANYEGNDHRWLRVRDEQNKITLNIKSMPKGEKSIDSVKEIEVEVSNFIDTCALLEAMGCILHMYQENKREVWQLDDAEVTIDTWPGMDPFIEIEAKSKKSVHAAALKLDLDPKQGISGSVGTVMNMLYGITMDELGELNELIFERDTEYREWLLAKQTQSESTLAK